MTVGFIVGFGQNNYGDVQLGTDALAFACRPRHSPYLTLQNQSQEGAWIDGFNPFGQAEWILGDQINPARIGGLLGGDMPTAKKLQFKVYLKYNTPTALRDAVIDLRDATAPLTLNPLWYNTNRAEFESGIVFSTTDGSGLTGRYVIYGQFRQFGAEDMKRVGLNQLVVNVSFEMSTPIIYDTVSQSVSVPLTTSYTGYPGTYPAPPYQYVTLTGGGRQPLWPVPTAGPSTFSIATSRFDAPPRARVNINANAGRAITNPTLWVRKSSRTSDFKVEFLGIQGAVSNTNIEFWLNSYEAFESSSGIPKDNLMHVGSSWFEFFPSMEMSFSGTTVTGTPNVTILYQPGFWMGI